MTKIQFAYRIQTIYILISLIGLASVSIMSLVNPQMTMNLVQVKLENTDAMSSIRGIYGGVGICLVLGLIYLHRQLPSLALAFLTMFWFSYAFSRYLTMMIDGPLHDFGNQWVMIESILAILGIGILLANRRIKSGINKLPQ